MTEMFTGFSTEGLEFLDELGRNDKAWFNRHRDTYASTVVAPTKAFVVALGERLVEEVSPGIVAHPKTNGSIAPINNDLRFSPSKAPYKNHLLLRFWEGAYKKTAPTLMVRISSDEIAYATGIAIPSTERWRVLVDETDSGQALASALGRLAEEHADLDIAGAELKRVPKPYANDHTRHDLLRHNKMIQARWREATPATIHSPAFIDHCVEQLRCCRDLHHWFLAHMA